MYVAFAVVTPAMLSDQYFERKISAKCPKKNRKTNPPFVVSLARSADRRVERKTKMLSTERRTVGAQSRDAYQTQLKSDDTVPVTAPPSPIKTTRARVSPRNSDIDFRVFGTPPHSTRRLQCLRRSRLISIHRGRDHEPMIALRNVGIPWGRANVRNVPECLAESRLIFFPNV